MKDANELKELFEKELKFSIVKIFQDLTKDEVLNWLKRGKLLDSKKGFEIFFLNCLFYRIKKTIAPLKHLRPFFFAFHLQLKNIKYKFQSFKTAQNFKTTPLSHI